MIQAKRCDSAMLHSLQAWLEKENLPSKGALIGFDGYVDSIYRVVCTRTTQGETQYYHYIADYGQRVIDAAGKSADIEIQQIERRLGGNAPLMAEGVAALGDAVTLVGELGYPQINPCFQTLLPSMKTYSFAEPCQTIALEFTDGKIMMGDMVSSDSINWETIREIVGDDTLNEQIANASLIAVLNWSAHTGVAKIAYEVASLVASLPAEQKRMMFFDLSDPNALSLESLCSYLNMIRDIGTMIPTVLGMNENEARTVIGCLFSEADMAKDTLDLAHLYGHQMLERLHLNSLTIHATAYALGFEAQEMWHADGFRIDKPLISTGGGDHYNAAFCHGLLHNLPLPQCLLLGSAASSYYVLNGRSAARNDLKKYLIQREELAV